MGGARARNIAVVLVTVVFAACRQGTAPRAPVIDEAPAPQRAAIPLTLEEAGLLAAGALVEIYGTSADPVPTDVDAARVRHRGQRVWQLDVTVKVTLGRERTDRSWRIWVGTLASG